MFFENEVLSFHILDVIELKQKKIHKFNKGRNFHALSFRYHAETVLKTNTAEYRMGDYYVCYVPARLDYTRSSETDELIVVHFDTINYNARHIECFLPQDPHIFIEKFRQILDCWNKKEIGYRYKCSAILYNIFAECYIQNYKSETQKSKIGQSVEYILKHYKKNDLSIREIAKRSFMSEVYFRKLFKEAYGVSPQKYIINLRIQNAAGLIATGYYTLKDVAYMSGYNDYKYFSVEFKKIMGVSPSEYLYNYTEEDNFPSAETEIPMQKI